MHHGILALVGPPNAGKTTLYNWLTGSRYRAVNYPGSTVEYLEGYTLDKYGPAVRILDTPGIRSLTPQSPEEHVTIDTLKDQSLIGSVGAVIVPVDATQMSRHLLLVEQLREAGFRVIIALTMVDLLKAKGQKINFTKLSQLLSVPVVEIDGLLGGGVSQLYKRAAELLKESENTLVEPIASWNEEKIADSYHKIDHIIDQVITSPNLKNLNQADPRTIAIDKWLMHPWLGLFFFVLVMAGLFTGIFWLAEPAMNLIDQMFSSGAEIVSNFGGGALWADFLGQGLISGFGAVVMFVPQIVILFFGLAILEDSGYLARAATLVDRPLSLIGLNGRSFVPLLSGFACAIPAMLAARTISNTRERLITIFVLPLASCSARLPVYALLLGFLLAGHPAWHTGLALAALYFSSIFFGGAVALVMSRIWKAKEPSWFMLELPAYRRPRLRSALRITLDRTLSYLKRAGGVILFVSVLIWSLTTFPNYREEDPSIRLEQSYASHLGAAIDPLMRPMGADWRVGVGLISAFAAREVFVSSLALIFHIAGEEETLQGSLTEAMRGAVNKKGEKLFTPASVVGLLVFFLIALQCLSTVAVSTAEAGRRWFGLTQLVTFNAVAYGIAVGAVNLLRALGIP